MNDPRVVRFLDDLRRELDDVITPTALEESLRETASHIEETVLELRAQGAEDPVGDALKGFGPASNYAKATETEGGGILCRHATRTALAWCAAVLLVPIAADLAMDFSAWFTGSDSGLYAVGIPVTLLLFLKFGAASRHVRRYQLLPIVGITAAAFSLFIVLGGFARATDGPGGLGTRTRGTAYRRRLSLIELTLPEKQAIQRDLQKAVHVFASPIPVEGIGLYRTSMGYLVPTIPEAWRQSWKGDPRAPRWLIDGIQYTPVKDYREASRQWQADGPQLLSLAESGVQGEIAEIAELQRVVDCPWAVSVRADLPMKEAMAMTALPLLLVVHALGMGAGALIRLRRRRQTA